MLHYDGEKDTRRGGSKLAAGGVLSAAASPQGRVHTSAPTGAGLAGSSTAGLFLVSPAKTR